MGSGDGGHPSRRGPPARHLFRAVNGERKGREKWAYVVFILFLRYTGARFGEGAGLRWEDLELDAPSPVVHIRHAAEGRYGPTKTGKSRDVPLTPELFRALKDWQHDRPGCQHKLRQSSLPI